MMKIIVVYIRCCWIIIFGLSGSILVRFGFGIWSFFSLLSDPLTLTLLSIHSHENRLWYIAKQFYDIAEGSKRNCCLLCVSVCVFAFKLRLYYMLFKIYMLLAAT